MTFTVNCVLGLALSACAVYSATTTTTSTITRPPECGTSLGCFDDCNTGCTYLVTWSVQGSNIHFRLQSLSSGDSWMAVGFSNDIYMGTDSVSECVVFGGVVKAFQSYNTGYSNSRLTDPTLGLAGVQGSLTNGVFECSFLREITGFGDDNLFNLTSPYYLLFSTGPANADFTKTKHAQTPVASTAKIDFTTFQETMTTASSSLITRPAECGTSLGCFDDCNPGCTYLVTWTVQSTDIHFRLKSLSSGNSWMAVGFSSDQYMGTDSVSECVVFGGVVKAFQSYNTGYSNSRLTDPTLGLTGVQGSLINGVFECSFLREITGFGDDNLFNLTSPYYLLFGTGPANADFTKTKHSQTPSVSSSQIDFTGFQGTTTTMTAASTPSSSLITRPAECGTSLGCFDDCNPGCTYLVTWAVQSTGIHFRLKSFSSGNSWMAVGFSSDQYMGDDSVSECVVYGGMIKAFQSYNTNLYTNNRLTNATLGLSGAQGSVTNGVFDCSFLREITGVGDDHLFNLTLSWYLLFATGPAKPDFTKVKHTKTPSVSSGKINFLNVTTPPTSSSTAPPLVTTTTPTSTGISRPQECGTTMGCFDDCDKGCSFLVTWSAEDNSINFRLMSFSSGDSWMAVGFSEDMVMGDDSVSECVSFGGQVKAFQSYNHKDYTNTRLTNATLGLSDVQGSINNGVFECRFAREMTMLEDDQFFNLTKTWHLMFGVGPALSDFSKRKHSHVPSVTSSKMDFQKFTSTGGTKIKYPLVQAHGSLMSFAWLVSVSIGLIIARFFKPLWPDNTIMGLKVWFQIHRSCMSTAFLATIVGFILIFVEIKGYSQITGSSFSKAHPILGIIVTALVILNPVMAFFRPGPKDDKRPIFNWAHFLVGTCAYILAVVTIFMGSTLSKSALPDASLYVLIGYAVWQLFAEASFEVIEILSKRKDKATINDIQLKDPSSPKEKQITPSQPHFTTMKLMLLGLHVCVVLGFFITVVILLTMD